MSENNTGGILPFRHALAMGILIPSCVIPTALPRRRTPRAGTAFCAIPTALLKEGFAASVCGTTGTQAKQSQDTAAGIEARPCCGWEWAEASSNPVSTSGQR